MWGSVKIVDSGRFVSEMELIAVMLVLLMVCCWCCVLAVRVLVAVIVVCFKRSLDPHNG